MTPYPFDRLRRVTRRDAAFESMIARWVDARPAGTRLHALVGGPVRVISMSSTSAHDPNAASCEVRVAGASIEVLGSSGVVRTIVQRVLGGPAELAAPRPLGAVEHAIWALVVATALEDLGIAGEVWPCEASPEISDAVTVGLAVEVDGATMQVTIRVPRALELRVPPARPVPAWASHAIVEIPIVLGRCGLPRAALGALAIRQVITLEPARELELLGGTVGVVIEPGAVVATVATGYVRRNMALPLVDDGSVELSVGLGTTQLSLRQVFELAVGAIVPLGRPLAGPFEVRAAGKLVGRGELVDVEGELGVRIVSLSEE